MRYQWKHKENGCWNDYCLQYKDGICQTPEVPIKLGCAATWTFYTRALYGYGDDI